MRRRVPHMLGLFLGAAWVGLEFTDWIVERYELSAGIVDMVFFGTLAMTPSVLLVAWFHGAPGRDRWRWAERVGVPLNLVFAVLLASQFNGRDVAEAASLETVETVDEQGQAVVRTVVKESFIRGVSVFFLGNDTDDPELDWLQYGFAVALNIDLQQNPYLSPWSAFDQWEQYGFFYMRKAGYPTGLGLPRSLQRQIAREGGNEYFLSGSFDRQGDQLTLTVDLYETDSGELLDSAVASGKQPLPLVDQVAAQLVDTMSIPSANELLTNRVEIVDLPVMDRLTESTPAFRHFIDGLVASSLDNDSNLAQSSYRAATQLDPSFALANLELGRSLWNTGQAGEATTSIQRALQHEYRLLDSQRFAASSLNYSFAGQANKQLAVLKMWSELLPHDPNSFISLAFAQIYAENNLAGALNNFRRAADLEPNQVWLQQQISQMLEIQGQADEAIAVLDAVRDRYPDDHSNVLALGRLLRRTGRLDEAAEQFERANLLKPSFVDPLLALVDIEQRRGNFAQAEARLSEARQTATTPRQEAAVLRGWLGYYGMRGMEDEYLATLAPLDEVSSRFRTAVNRVMDVWATNMAHFVFAERSTEGLAKLEELASELEPPIDTLLQLGYLQIYLAQGDPDAAELAGTRLEAFMRRYKREDLEYAISYAKSQIVYIRGDLNEAIRFMEESKMYFADSIQRLETEADTFDIDSVLARYYIEANRPSDAEALLTEALRLYPAFPAANILMARIRLDQSNLAEAQQFADVAQAALAQASPGNPERQRLDELLGRWPQ